MVTYPRTVTVPIPVLKQMSHIRDEIIIEVKLGFVSSLLLLTSHSF